jgi:monofunctional glycosyltransferase
LKRRLIRWTGLALLAFAGLFLLLQAWYLVQIAWYKTHDPGLTSFMQRQLTVLQERDPGAKLKQQYVPYERISVQLKKAVIASEDANFSYHEGVDWEAIERAYEKNRRAGKPVRGGSTITMQLAKNLFLSESKSYWRKGEELIISYMLETVLDKERILELYLNVAEWGVGVFGAEAAARHHFGVAASQLSVGQAARLASMLPNPRFYDKNRQHPRLIRRATLIARHLHSAELP